LTVSFFSWRQKNEIAAALLLVCTAIMAFNPRTYETVYGFNMLDELHNFFPEMLYDDIIFSNNLIRYMRYRMNTLFPHAFPRQQSIYRIYLSEARREDVRQWRRQETRDQVLAQEVPVVQYPVRTVAAASTRPATSSLISEVPVVSTSAAAPAAASAAAPASAQVNAAGNNNTIPALSHSNPINTILPHSLDTIPSTPVSRRGITAAPPVHPRRVSRLTPLSDPMNDLLTVLLAAAVPGAGAGAGAGRIPAAEASAWDNAMYANLMGNPILAAWQDVIVAPTNEQIDAGSELVEHIDIPVDTNCAICMERGEPQQWRRLHCSHAYHKRCIDTWFQQNVHCAVCRADVRDAPTDSEEEE
jgi:hypothetical protein